MVFWLLGQNIHELLDQCLNTTYSLHLSTPHRSAHNNRECKPKTLATTIIHPPIWYPQPDLMNTRRPLSFSSPIRLLSYLHSGASPELLRTLVLTNAYPHMCIITHHKSSFICCSTIIIRYHRRCRCFERCTWYQPLKFPQAVDTVHDPNLQSGLEVKNLLFDGSPSRYPLTNFNICLDCISLNVCQILCWANECMSRQKSESKGVESGPLDFRANLARPKRARHLQRRWATFLVAKQLKLHRFVAEVLYYVYGKA